MNPVIRAEPYHLGSQPAGTSVTYLAVGCHYIPPSLWFSSIILLPVTNYSVWQQGDV